MTNKHDIEPSEIGDHWLLDQASGSSPMAVQVLFSCAAELNPAIRDRLELAEQAGAALMDESLWAEPEQLSEPLPDPAFNPPRTDRDPVYPAALARYGFHSGWEPWRSRLGGVRGRKINRLCEPGIDARLFRIEPGASIPHHDHAAAELTLVLQGGFSDHRGEYHRGDVCEGEAGIAHRPVGLAGEPCICFAVSLGGYRFRNPLMAIAARMLT